MLKGALRRKLHFETAILGAIKKVEGWVFCPKLSVFKKIYLTLDVEIKKLLGSVRISKGTAVMWAPRIIKKVISFVLFQLNSKLIEINISFACDLTSAAGN